MEYKPNLAQVVDRHRRLWTGRLRDGILAILDVHGAPWDPYNLPDEYRGTEMDPLAQVPDIRRMFEAWDLCFSRRCEILDDWLPVARMGLGGYDVGGMLGGELVFAGGAPFLARPLLDSWADIETLRLDEDSRWYRHRLEMCAYFAEHARGKFACCEGDTVTAGNLLELVRGWQAYLDIIDGPESCRRVMARGVEWTSSLLAAQRRLLGDVRRYGDGSLHNFYIWLPGDSVWLSMDFYGSCKPDTYQQLGREWDQQLINRSGGGWVHLHSNALHILPDVMTLQGLRGVGIWEDPPPQPRPFERLDSIRHVTGNMPLLIRCRLSEFVYGLETRSLPGGICYEVIGLTSVTEANELMRWVLAYVPGDASHIEKGGIVAQTAVGS
jgi:hypothetical protein